MACGQDNAQNKEQLKTEILKTERAFSQMARDSGIASAFLHFVAADGVIKRGDQLFKGKEEIETYFESHNWNDIKLTWEPEFADVSASGDLGYTYGKYTMTMTDTTGNPIQSKGIFHTIWKRQPDGTWKFVWD